MTEVGGTEDETLLALLASNDSGALAEAMRDWNAGSLLAVTGDQTGFLGTVAHRIAGQPGFTVSAEARDAARRAIELREQGAKIARDALHGLGYRYSEPAAILPHVTPWGTLGLVNSSTGVAAATDLPVPPDVAAALSGTCGELAHLPDGIRQAILRRPPSGPGGWTRIHARITGHGTRPARMTARITHWCLPAGDEAGEPGATVLDGMARFRRLRPEDWPCGRGVRRRMDEAGQRALLAIARELAAMAGCLKEMEQALADPGEVAWEVPPADHADAAVRGAAAVSAVAAGSAHLPPIGSAEGLLGKAAGSGYGGRGACRDVAAEAGVFELASACGAPQHGELVAAILARIARQELLPVAEAAASACPGPREPGEDGSWGPVYRRHDDIVQSLAVLVRKAAAAWLREVLRPTVFGDAVTAATREMAAVYKEGGPVEVDIELPVPGHLEYPAGAPVGLAEICERLGVKRGTADRWRQRDQLPEPDWPVGGRPAWKWATIARWWGLRGGTRPGDEPEEDDAG